MTEAEYKAIMDDIDEKMKEHEKIFARLEKSEDDALKNVLKHFDRIHDKLFTINTVFIAGFFTLIKISSDISTYTIFVPVVNMIYLVWMEYRMMKKSRFELQIATKTPQEIAEWGKSISRNNLYSLLSILITLTVAVYFIYCLYVSDGILAKG